MKITRWIEKFLRQRRCKHKSLIYYDSIEAVCNSCGKHWWFEDALKKGVIPKASDSEVGVKYDSE